MKNYIVFVAILPFRLVMAEVPQQINHSGKVSVDGAPFIGTGYFKFAINGHADCETYSSQCTRLWSNDRNPTNGHEP